MLKPSLFGRVLLRPGKTPALNDTPAPVPETSEPLPDGADALYVAKLDDLLAACRAHLPRFDEGLVRRAYRFSFEKHRDLKRASGEPYYLHPVEVARIVATEIALDDISVVGALLHDVVEDTDTTIDDIRVDFGPVVANIVDGATKITDIFKSREVKQAESFRKMLLSMTNDLRVILVKFADRLHNMRTLEHLSPEKQYKIAIETRDIYAPFAHRFGLGKIKWELEDLSFKYIDPPAYVALAKQVKERRETREQYVTRFIAPLSARLKELNVPVEISGRPKHLYSIYNKMKSRGKPFEEIYDLFAIRIILDTDATSACFAAYGVVTEVYLPVSERFKDYISVPKKNGYQSIHTTVIGPNGRMVEVQIRTRSMHEVAERGVAAHWRYKENPPEQTPGKVRAGEMEAWVNWVRDIFEQPTDSPTQFMEGFRLNLYQDEIYLFTPKGELKILPKEATPVDFAYEIHTEVGHHCIGAKVNGKIVPLPHRLKSGDQVEIITSKHQTPNADWEKFVVTHKAKVRIRQWINEAKRIQVDSGRELWAKKAKKARIILKDDELVKLAHHLRFDSLTSFYQAIGSARLEADEAVRAYREKLALGRDRAEDGREASFGQFVQTARGQEPSAVPTLLIDGRKEALLHTYARCCNPIPGDDVVGFVSLGEGIKIHRKSCKNITNRLVSNEPRLIEVDWPRQGQEAFIVGVKLTGEDRQGMLNDITHTISRSLNTNIRSVNFVTKDGIFDGTVIVHVRDTSHLGQLLERLKRIGGVFNVERFEE